MVDQLCWVTVARVQRPSVSTRCPGRRALESKGPRGPPALPGDSRWGPGACGFNHHSLANRARVPMSRAFEQPSGVIHARARRPSWLTTCPTLLLPVSKDPRCRPALPGNSGLGPRIRGFNEISRVTRARV